ncbi:MAG: MBL fold metallo-hydrolase [Syntrophomonadaceae bacterium]|nr:MBL fold metallo-hydrolase [Syntrophomonadaceae bacterium]
MIQEVMQHIYRIPIPLPENPLKELNCYLIRGKKRNLMIDTGFRHEICRQALLTGLDESGINMEETDVLLTHLHSDHTGLISDVVSNESRVFINELDRNWLTRYPRFELEEQTDKYLVAAGVNAEMIATAAQTHPGRKFAPDPDFNRYEYLSHGDVLTVGDYRLEIIHTPGHTPGHLCLWLEEQKTMFTGDHILFDITPNITHWTNCENSLGHYLDSLRRIYLYDVQTALPSHRTAGNFHSRIDELLRHHEIRLSECLEAVRKEPGLLPFEISGRMTWRIRAKDWNDFPISQKWFAVGECLAHLDHLMHTGDVREEVDNGLLRYYPA